jgi:hypothetical protein
MGRKAEFIKVPPLLGDLPPEEVAKALAEIGAKARSRYEQTSKELLELLTKNDPILILAVMGLRFFAVQALDERDDHRPPAAQQHHLELLQGMALIGSPPKVPESVRLADIVERIIDLLDTNAQAFNFSRMHAPEPGTEETAKRQALVLEQIRGTTQFVRGEFYPHQLDRYLRSIFRHIDDDFGKAHGITGAAVLEILQRLMRTVEDKLNDHRQRCRKVLKSYKAKKAVKNYFEMFPEESPRRDSILAAAAARQVQPHHMRFFLLEEADRFLPRVFSFGEDDVNAACPAGADRAAAKRAIEAWSLAFGDLRKHRVEHLYLANPVWDRPFIKLTDGRFFWPSPGTSLSFQFEMFERLIATNAELLQTYEDARANVLEEELGLLLKKYYPDGRVIRGARWTSPADRKEYENDVVVLIDHTALLFEAKSGKVSAEAKRGADRRLKREIDKLMVEPAAQSKRLMELLKNDRREHAFQSRDGEQVIDSRNIDRFIRVNVTFNIIGALSSRWPYLVEADLMQADAVQIPTMSIADLDTVCSALNEQATITHYLHRRSAFEAAADYFADEIDLLAFYLKTGFNIGETEFDGTPLMIYGMSDELNAYFKRQAEVERPTRPVAERTRLFGRIVSALENRRPEHWLELTGRLLNVGIDDQETIERNIGPSVAKVRKSRDASMSWSAQLANGPPQRREAITFVWYRCADRDDREARLRTHAGQAMELAGTDDCLLVGFDITSPADAYSVIGLFKKRVRDA